MPKRVVDGEALWRSDKIALIQPPRLRSEYANLLPLALANGTFEANSRRIWSQVYAYNRPDVTPDDVDVILNEFERVRLLFRWKTPDGKMWGFWTGIDKPGRLPGPSRQGKNEAVGPPPPMDSVRKFLDSNECSTESAPGNKKLLGFGFGFGSGLGSGLGSEKTVSSKPENGFDQPVLGEDFQTEHKSNGKPPQDFDATLATVWDYYISVFKKNPHLYTFTAKRKSKGVAALKFCLTLADEPRLENAAAMMRGCIDRFAASEFHNGKNKNATKYLDWELLFRNQEKLSYWLDDANFSGTEARA